MNKIIEEVIQRSNDRLQFEKGSQFTQEGFDELKTEIASYINSLITESYRIAKRNKGDLISKSHIQSASFQLIKKHSKDKKQVLASVGGFFVGFSISKALELVADGQKISSSHTIVILIAGIVGAFILGISIFRTQE